MSDGAKRDKRDGEPVGETPRRRRTASTGRACKLCASPLGAGLDGEVLSGAISGAEAARRVGASRSAASRHYLRHVLPGLDVTGAAPVDVHAEARRLYGIALASLAQATAAGSWPGRVAFLREARSALDLVHRITSTIPTEKGVAVAMAMIRTAAAYLPDPRARAAFATELRAHLRDAGIVTAPDDLPAAVTPPGDAHDPGTE